MNVIKNIAPYASIEKWGGLNQIHCSPVTATEAKASTSPTAALYPKIFFSVAKQPLLISSPSSRKLFVRLAIQSAKDAKNSSPPSPSTRASSWRFFSSRERSGAFRPEEISRRLRSASRDEETVEERVADSAETLEARLANFSRFVFSSECWNLYFYWWLDNYCGISNIKWHNHWSLVTTSPP